MLCIFPVLIGLQIAYDEQVDCSGSDVLAYCNRVECWEQSDIQFVQAYGMWYFIIHNVVD